MKSRVLGNNHLTVSAIGLGCWGMSHAYGPADENESLATMNKCLDMGLNFLDTADVYGDGHNEILISKILKHRRKEAVIGTKFGFVGDEHGTVKVCGKPDYVRKACEKSLKRLGVDAIDLYYFHRLDPDVPIEETVGAMADLIRQGKVRYLGLSEVSAETVRKANFVHPVTAIQSEYSLWHREVETNIIPTCRELNISLVPYSPLGRGFLTGTISKSSGFDKSDYRNQIPRFKPETIDKNVFIVDRLQELAKSVEISPSQLSLAWILAKDKRIVPIPGMKQRKYIEENIAAADIVIPDEIMNELDHLGDNVTGSRHNEYNLQFIDT